MPNVSSTPRYIEGSRLDMHVDRTSKNPWNLPDWRNPAEYPSVKRTSDFAWRWEFLRRHPSYRRIWLAYQSNQASWNKRRSNDKTRAEELARRFQIDRLYSPACRHNQFYLPLEMIMGLYEITPAFRGDMSGFCKRAAKKGQYLIAISPTASLSDQLTCIEADILSMNREWQGWDVAEKSPDKPRWTRRNFCLYLRVLDARDPTHPDPAGPDKMSSVFREEKHTKKMDKDGVIDLEKSAQNTLDKFLLSMPA